jgi:plastocyanin
MNRPGDRLVVASMNRFLRLAAAAAAVAFAVAACSSGDGSSSSAAPAAATTTSATTGATTSAPAGGEATSSAAGGGTAASTGTITVLNFAYGSPLTVAPGAMITVTNQDAAAHDVVSDDDGKFRTPLLKQGENATFTAPVAPGTYKFSCSVHANMTGIGTLIVQG